MSRMLLSNKFRNTSSILLTYLMGVTGGTPYYLYGQSAGAFPQTESGVLRDPQAILLAALPANRVSHLALQVQSGLTVTVTRGDNTVNDLAAGTSSPIAVVVKDASGKPVSDAAVLFTAPAAGPTVTFNGSAKASVTSDLSGLATAPFATPKGGEGVVRITVTALYNGLSGRALVVQRNVAAAIANPQTELKIVIPDDNQVNKLEARVPKPITVTVLSADRPVAGAKVNFTAPAQGPGGTFAGDKLEALQIQTDASGVASSPPFTPNKVDGPFVIKIRAEKGGVVGTADMHQTNERPEITKSSHAWIWVLVAAGAGGGGAAAALGGKKNPTNQGCPPNCPQQNAALTITLGVPTFTAPK